MDRRLGLWLCNGDAGHTREQMYSWHPAMITCFFDYLGIPGNDVFGYKRNNPDVDVVIRFQHNQSWMLDWQTDAENKAKEIALAKWPTIAELDPYVYFCNECNLHYESGIDDPGKQWMFEVEEFYKLYGMWVTRQAEIIKNYVPEMKLVCPPFAFGHNEDGWPANWVTNDDIDWCGYDYLSDAVSQYFDNTLTFHGYWHESNLSELYDPETAKWYAYRWRRLLDLFEMRYCLDCKVIIDECGNFDAGSAGFTQQLMDYGTQCLRDSRVLGVTPFLWLDPTQSPGNMPNSWYQQMTSDQLQEHLNKLAVFSVPVIDPEPPEPEPDCDCQSLIDIAVIKDGLQAIKDSFSVMDAKISQLKNNC